MIQIEYTKDFLTSGVRYLQLVLLEMLTITAAVQMRTDALEASSRIRSSQYTDFSNGLYATPGPVVRHGLTPPSLAVP